MPTCRKKTWAPLVKSKNFSFILIYRTTLLLSYINQGDLDRCELVIMHSVRFILTKEDIAMQ